MNEATTKSNLPAVVTFLLAFFIGYLPIPSDPDLWFHLADGRMILQNHQVPDADPFSFTRNGELWVPHSWLFDTLLWPLWSLSPRGSEAVMAGVFAGAVMISWSILIRHQVPAMTAMIVCSLLAVAMGNTRGLRPQVFSLLLCNVVLWLLMRTSKMPGGQGKPHPWPTLILIPLVFLLWAQLHGACVMGLVVLTVWLGGECVEFIATGSLATRWKEWLMRVGTFVLSVLAVLITPHRVNHFQYVALTMKLKELRRAAEWQAPKALSLESPDVFLYLLMMVVLILLARSAKKVRWPALLVEAALILLAFTGVRHIPLACIASVPLFAQVLGKESSVAIHNVKRSTVIGSVGSILLVAALWRFPCDIQTRYQRAEPIAGAQALMQLNRPLRVLTTYNTGSYLLYADSEHLKVFVDSRADVYGDSILAEAFAVMNGHHLDTTAAHWQCDAVVVDRVDPAARILADSPQWQPLAEDPSAVTYLRRPILEHRKVP